MSKPLIFAGGVAVGIAITLFTSLLTELIVLAAVVGVVFYIGRKRWAKPKTGDTPSTTSTSL